MNKIKIRFNTEWKEESGNQLFWRVLIDDKEFLASDVEVNVPTKTIAHVLPNGTKKWSIYCESDNYYFDENNKFYLGKAEKYIPSVIWLTGLSGAGKTTIANSLLEILKGEGEKVVMLDGDAIRNVFKTGFDKQSRIEHNLSVGKMASLLQRQGFIVMVSLISPYAEAREKSRAITNNFIEVYISTPLEVCENRDVKGLYAKARRGEIKQFTGIDDIYEPPISPELIINTTEKSILECTNSIIGLIVNHTSPKVIGVSLPNK